MTDFVKTLFTDLSAEEAAGGWDQTNYPSAIHILDPHRPQIMQHSNLIDITLYHAQSSVDQLGINTSHPRFIAKRMGVFLTVKRLGEYDDNYELLQEVIDEFISWLEEKAYNYMHITDIFYNGLTADLWIKGYEVI